MATFSITAATNSLHLQESEGEEAERSGVATFTVFNASGQPLRGRALPATDDETVRAWLHLNGEAERAFPIAGAESFDVTVRVPPEAPAGSYQFRLDAVDVARPEETHVRGPVVAFSVREPAAPERTFPWWILLVVLGVLALGGLAAYLFWPDGGTRVPDDLAGLTVAAAETRLGEVGLARGDVIERPDEANEAGIVLSSDPSSGAEVEEGTAVDLVVSSGPDAPFVIPAVSQLPRAEARSRLEAVGLTVGEVVEQTHTSVGEGLAIRTSPRDSTEVDPDTTTVTLFVSVGPPFMAWGRAGAGDGQFNSPTGVAVAGRNTVYVVDKGSDRVQKFTADGTFVRTWGSRGSANGQFQDPADVTVNMDGDVYVADQGNNRIQQFGANGNHLASFGQQINGAEIGENAVLGHFTSVNAVSATSGTFVIAGDILTGVHRFDLRGNPVSLITGFKPGGIGAAAGGTFFLVNTNGTTVYQLNSNGGVLIQRDIRDISGAGGEAKPSLTDVAVDGDGNVYVADRANDRVLKFDPNVQTLVRAWGQEGTGLGQFRNPAGVDVGADGFIYVADSGNRRIVRIHPLAPNAPPRRSILVPNLQTGPALSLGQ